MAPTPSSRGGGGVSRGGHGGRAAKSGSHRKGAAAGSGGQRRKALEGRKATPPAEMRPGHPAQRRAAAAAKRATGGAGEKTGRSRNAGSGGGGGGGAAAGAGAGPARAGGGRRRPTADGEIVIGRNSVVEALRGEVPATELYVAGGLEYDDRLDEARALAADAGLAVVDVTRTELDRLTEGAPHQGLGLAVPAYSYAHPDDLLARALAAPPGLLVALDGVTDPRNLGAVVRSAAAFGAQGVVVPERRSAGMTASAWKTSAGAAARLPVARAVNLTRTLTAFMEAGLFVVGLAADGDVSLDDLDVATEPIVVVAGSEGRGLSRLVGETCDLTVRIPMSGQVESLNAGVAAGVALAEVARRRRSA